MSKFSIKNMNRRDSKIRSRTDYHKGRHERKTRSHNGCFGSFPPVLYNRLAVGTTSLQREHSEKEEE